VNLLSYIFGLKEIQVGQLEVGKTVDKWTSYCWQRRKLWKEKMLDLQD